MKNSIFTVSEINEIIHTLFVETPLFQQISIKGEITNFKGPNRSGHFYFCLKDQNSIISVVIFKFDSYSINMDIKNGDKVIATGSLSTYSSSGTYQLIIHDLIPCGKGELLIEREKLKEKLYKLGYFDADHKKNIPPYAEKIAIITGKNSAAAKDFEHNIKRRWPIAQISFYECLVQGEKAPSELESSIKEADNSNFDLIIIGRGGGASDDLNVFDDEKVVSAIYSAKTPIISAIGHEINQTFSDLAADRFASTPTGACEIAVPNYEDVQKEINYIYSSILDKVHRKILFIENKLNLIKGNKKIQSISFVFDNKISYIHKITDEIISKAMNKINYYELQLVKYKERINSANKEELLKKGYFIIEEVEGKAITKIQDLSINTKYKIIGEDGNATINVEELKYEEC